MGLKSWLGFCEHIWKEYGRTPYFYTGSLGKSSGTMVILRCKKCGNIRKVKV